MLYLGQVGRLAHSIHSTESDSERPTTAFGGHDITQDINAAAWRQDLDKRVLQAGFYC